MRRTAPEGSAAKAIFCALGRKKTDNNIAKCRLADPPAFQSGFGLLYGG